MNAISRIKKTLIKPFHSYLVTSHLVDGIESENSLSGIQIYAKEMFKLTEDWPAVAAVDWSVDNSSVGNRLKVAADSSLAADGLVDRSPFD